MGKNCVVEKAEDQCCPTISCPPGKYICSTGGWWWYSNHLVSVSIYRELEGGGGI